MSEDRFTLKPEEVFEHGRLPAVCPGEVLSEDFMLTEEMLSEKCEFSTRTARLVLSGEIPIDEDLAQRLSDCVGCSEQFWLDLQAAYDAEKDREP